MKSCIMALYKFSVVFVFLFQLDLVYGVYIQEWRVVGSSSTWFVRVTR